MKSVSTLLGKVLVGMLAAAPFFAAAQTTTEKYQPKDSINVRDKHLFRQWSYEQNNSAYPAPKKDNWSIGLIGGPSWVSGDVNHRLGWSGGLNVRRSMGHLLSLRIGAVAGSTKGINWQPSAGFLQNTALNGAENANSNYTTAAYPLVYHNFSMRYLAANADLVASINNINFYNKQPRIGLHVFGGLGFMTYGTYVDALNANGSMYDYSGVPLGVVLDDRADALNALDNLLDGEYETEADEYFNKSEFLNGTCIPTLSLGGGVSYKLGRRVDLMLEYRATFTHDDLLDGQRWEETNTASGNFDMLNNASLGINFRLGKGEDSKWWTNPLDAPYSSIRTLKAMSNKETADSDGDGVVDALDKESGTPKGARVDSHGKALDSDGDGVQDFRDREPFSLAGAEVDRDGIALDGDGDGVPNLLDREPNSAAGAQVDVRGVTIKAAGAGAVTAVPATLPMVHFDYNSSEVKTMYFEELMEIAKMMRDNPAMKLRVTGHTDVRNSNNKNDDLSKARAESVANLLSTRFGVDKSRLIVEFKGATQPLVTLPADRDPKNEPMHNLNRRVEFEIVK